MGNNLGLKVSLATSSSIFVIGVSRDTSIDRSLWDHRSFIFFYILCRSLKLSNVSCLFSTPSLCVDRA